MNSTDKHIISTFKWDTTFDQKEKAIDLQRRLSAWSQRILLNELSGLLNHLCPEDQTWKINSLELNLGAIAYETLEQDLPGKIREKLQEKLVELVLSSASQEKEIEILDHNGSQLEHLRIFLLTGVPQWNQHFDDGSMNDKMSAQLHFNREEAIKMVKQVGATHKNVRKRMAWQLNETNLRKVVRGLEPGNCDHIFHFSNELVKIQEQENTFQASTVDFKKHLYWWILEHLLSERGTIFNKVAFMRSNLRQMARHYNMEYINLLRLITHTLHKMEKNISLKSDFFRVIKVLSAEDPNPSESTGITVLNTASAWNSIEDLVSFQPSQGEEEQPGLDELMENLSGNAPARFREFVFKLVEVPNRFREKTNRLNKSSLDLIAGAIAGEKSAWCRTIIDLLTQLCKKRGYAIDDRELWLASVNFLLKQEDHPHDQTRFIACMVESLCVQINQDKSELLFDLAHAEVPTGSRSPLVLEAMQQLSELSEDALISDDKKKFRERLYYLLDELSSVRVGTSSEWQKTEEDLLRFIVQGPADILNLLAAYPHEEKLEIILRGILDDVSIRTVLKKSGTQTGLMLAAACDVLEAMKPGPVLFSLHKQFLQHLPHSALLYLLRHPGSDQNSAIENIELSLLNLLPPSEREKATQLFYQIVQGKNQHDTGEFHTGINTVRGDETGTTAIDFAMVSKLITKEMSPGTVGKLVGSCFDQPGFVEARKKNSPTVKIILERLTGKSKKWMDEAVRVMLSIVQKAGITGKKITAEALEEILWKCVLRYEIHQAKASAIRKAFLHAVVYKFKLTPDVLTMTAEKLSLAAINRPAILGKHEVSAKTIAAIENALLNKIKKTSTDEIAAPRLPDLVSELLQDQPEEMYQLLKKIPVTERRIKLVMQAISFPRFCGHMTAVCATGLKEEFRSVTVFFQLLSDTASAQFVKALEPLFWKYCWSTIQKGHASRSGFHLLIQTSIKRLLLDDGMSRDYLLQQIRKIKESLPGPLNSCLITIMPEIMNMTVVRNDRREALLQLEQSCLVEELMDGLLRGGELPFWLEKDSSTDATSWLNEAVKYTPLVLLRFLKREQFNAASESRLHHLLGFENLVSAIGQLEPGKRSQLEMMSRFYAAIGHISFTGLTSSQVQLVLFRKLISAWKSGNWKIISSDVLLTELTWDLTMTKQISKPAFIRDLNNSRFSLPVSFQVSLRALVEKENRPATVLQKIPVASQKKGADKSPVLPTQKRTGIAVRNAGLVLIQNYIPLLFERLGIVADRKFIEPETDKTAVHYLQYAVTGMRKTEESYLPLNKLLCGLPLSEPVPDEIMIPDTRIKLIEGLIQAAISHWPAIGDCSVAGFRGNWLVRDGILFEAEDKWELTVEKRSYDILINQSPFSFSIIKYPWMPKPLHVNWPY